MKKIYSFEKSRPGHDVYESEMAYKNRIIRGWRRAFNYGAHGRGSRRAIPVCEGSGKIGWCGKRTLSVGRLEDGTPTCVACARKVARLMGWDDLSDQMKAILDCVAVEKDQL